ncbi:uncharacterized protein LOC122672212 [Telopea speciosissima]|uniref:uncharacterized protein LOC122672212 n=1 Tax=Telopea speciosissima TaxID=54955 RepID=UPI001CC782B7|nr:uncharacterized protein LOC122672212 [Telopea speciosissima]
MVNTHNQNHSPPRDDVDDVSEERLPAPPLRAFICDVAAQLQNAGREGPRVPPQVHEVPNPPANATPITPPPGLAANEILIAQTNQDPPPPPSTVLPVRNVTEDVKARWFERGLRASLSTAVVLHKYPTYAKVVEVAKLIEDQQRENYRAIRVGKRPISSHDSRGSSKFQRRGSYTNEAPIQFHRPDFAQVPKSVPTSHYGAQTLICYNCKESGHMAKDCPQSRQPGSWPVATSKPPLTRTVVRPLAPAQVSKTQGQVYSITHEEAQSDLGVITGMISVCSLPAYVLFDSRASHSFILPSFAEKLPIEPAVLEQKLMVRTSTGSKVELDRSFHSCPVRVSDYGLEANLIILDMKDFDVILGMDWLSMHGASLICEERKILFRTGEDNEFVFKGNKSKKPKNPIISALQVQKLLAQGCQCYLASVVDAQIKVTPMEEISVVRDFPDVFLGNLTRLPPDREMEFMIDLIPGAAPVSKAPYRMAPSELKELQG